MQEIYILTKHANFSAEYVENLPTYKRRLHLHFLETEVEELKKHQEAQVSKARAASRKR